MNIALGIAIFMPVVTTGLMLVPLALRGLAITNPATLGWATATPQRWNAETLAAQKQVSQKAAERLIAQTTETGCRQVHSATGVYTQPNLDSSSRGVLSGGQTVRLDLAGSSTGWARITEPLIGWVEAKYLTPVTACTSLGYTPATTTPTTTPAATPTASPSSPVATTTTVSAVCEVLPTEGLVVRSEPSISGNTVLHTIPKGRHQFQFTNNHLTTHTGRQSRYWTYITAPYQGWISLGVVGGSFNLGGRECG